MRGLSITCLYKVDTRGFYNEYSKWISPLIQEYSRGEYP